ncbi:MAG TPA: tetratricopeptide repeat protein [Gemmata sp.]
MTPLPPAPVRVRWLTAPFRFVIRRPVRAAGYLLLVALVVGAAAAGAAAAWFYRHLRSAEAELALGHNARAVRHLHECRRLYAGHRRVLLLSARAAWRSGALKDAEALLDEYAARYGYDEPVVAEQLLLRAVKGDVEGAEPQLLARTRAGSLPPDLASEAVVTGLLVRFRWAEAHRRLTEWLERAPDATAALLLLGKLEEQRQGVLVAQELYQRAVDRDPDHDEARLRLTALLIANRRGAEALPHAEALRHALPNSPEAAVHRVRALALVGRTAESRAALAECRSRYPEFAPALVEEGAAALSDGDEGAAARAFGQAVQLDPGNLVARNQYAFALARVGKGAEAAQAKAEAERLQGDLERISVLITGPLQLRPNDPAVHHEIAMIALRSGLVDEAIRWFTSALQVDPDYTPTHRALVSVYRALDNPVLAARHRALAQRGDPSAP